jgi:hypothetical protein
MQLFFDGHFSELGLAVVFGLDVRIECGIAEIGFAAGAGECPAIFVIPSPPFPLGLLALVVVEYVVADITP